MKRWLIPLVIIAVVAGGIFMWRRSASNDKPTGKFRTGVVDRGPVQTVVTATGTASAVTTVQVGSQVSGTIREILVDFNSPVKKGQVIARLDPTFLQAAVSENEANLERAQATHTQTQRDLARSKDLYEKNLAPRADYDNALTAVDVARASVRQAEATLQRAKVNLAYSVITAPIDGVVISRAVDEGQTVAASLQAPTLFTIAQDLRQMQIETNIDEADIGGLEEGMEATFTVDSYPEETFTGTISQIRYAATQDQTVVTYPVILTVANPDLKLRPGMTANVRIVTASRDDVVRFPATALRFRPPGTGNNRNGNGAAAERRANPAAAQAASGENRRAPRETGTPEAGADTLRGLTRSATVHVKGADGQPESRRVTIGLNDGTNVELVRGELQPGDSVIVGMAATSTASNNTGRMPGMGGPPMGGPRR